MGKYLLLIGGALLIYWIVRASLRRRKRDQAQTQGKAASEDMVRCVECGIHLPRGESLTLRGQFYCCADHQRRHDPGT
ncbi:MAG: PP0621 family protein [Burkholderiales bacterium]